MTGDIHFERRAGLGVVTLDRQSALNALTHDMIRRMGAQLAQWRADPGVAAVLVKAAPGRAFCAGGDIVAVTRLVREHGVAAATPFFRDEYRLNWRVHTFPKPYIALIDGIAMGGGVGISVHGRFRVATERTQFAMPETGIGFFPDVGGTWFLPRCPGGIGTYLGLTGARLSGADCVVVGLATHGVPADRLAALERELEQRSSSAAEVASVLAEAQGPIGAPEIAPARAAIDRCFVGERLADLLAQLAAEPDRRGAVWRDQLAVKSPFALALTFAQLRRGVGLTIEDALRLEYRMVHRVLAGPDFAEGVRALLIDKDRRPQWQHASAADVPPAVVETCFAPLPDGDLAFDWKV
jgi:enoyl-CoA hydratase